MNNPNILKLIKVISDEENFFSMASWDIVPVQLDYPEHFRARYLQEPPSCGTPACLGGWTDKLIGDEGEPQTYRTWFGLHETQIDELFCPKHKPWNEITRQEAIDTLENLYITGKVIWDVSDA